MGRLTTHVLDTARGCPARGLRIVLYRLDGDRRVQVADTRTNADGRTDSPILPDDKFAPGVYELEFHAGAYLGGYGSQPEAPRFLDVIPIRFGMSAHEQHYHVPLLLSPFGYTTYRGS